MAKLPVEKRKATKGKPAAPTPKLSDGTTKTPTDSVNSPSTINNDEKDRERKWRAEDALRDIERAEGHKRDGKLMKDVKVLATEKMKSLSKVASGPKGYKGD